MDSDIVFGHCMFICSKPEWVTRCNCKAVTEEVTKLFVLFNNGSLAGLTLASYVLFFS